MKSNYSNFVDYYNSHLHKNMIELKTLVPNKDSRYVVGDATTSRNVFNDQDKLTGFVFPIIKTNLKINIILIKIYGLLSQVMDI